MKANFVKIIIAILISLLVSIINYYVAPVEEYRNWISLGVSFLTIASLLICAIGIDYHSGQRTVNIKIVSILGVLFAIIGNVVFSNFMYPIIIYVAVMGIVSLLFILLIYSLIPKKDEASQM